MSTTREALPLCECGHAWDSHTGHTVALHASEESQQTTRCACCYHCWSYRPALAEPLPTAGWQEIATAPPSKSALVCWTDQPDWQPEALYRRADGSWTDGESDATYRTPTHWMPLPSPPQEPTD